MPSKSKKQHNFMAMCANNPKSATKKCPPKSVAKEYIAADKKKSKK